jgi:hypothetical protein
MKQTQISLGFTDKDVDGIRGIKTTAAINARDEVSAQIMALKSQLLLIDLWTYKIARPEQSRQEDETGEKSVQKETQRGLWLS